MKFQNRLAAVLSSAMLALNSIGAQSAFAASNSYDKLGMKKLFTFETGDLTDGSGISKSDWLVLPEDDDSDSYYLAFDYENMLYPTLDISFERHATETKTNTEIIDGKAFTSKEETMMSTIDVCSERLDDLPQKEMFLCKASRSKSNLLYAFQLEVSYGGKPLSDGPCSLTCTIYGRKKTDTPDPSLSEITGTTTGTASVGPYEPDYQPFFTDEFGNQRYRGTNAYRQSILEITQYPKQHFALGEPFTTEGLKVILTEECNYNSRKHDISDCLQIRTDYDPDTPGEYLVYIRTDYKNGNASSDDYIFYKVTVDADLTTSETTEFTVEAESGPPPVGEILRGDVDCSGAVQIADAVLLARYIAEDAVTVTSQGLVNAELDGEAGLTAGDLSVLLEGIAGSRTL